MSEDEFTKLYKYMTKQFGKIGSILEHKAESADVHRVFDLLDKVAKKQEIDNEVRLVMGYQLSRLDRWIHEVADKIGYKLTTY